MPDQAGAVACSGLVGALAASPRSRRVACSGSTVVRLLSEELRQRVRIDVADAELKRCRVSISVMTSASEADLACGRWARSPRSCWR